MENLDKEIGVAFREKHVQDVAQKAIASAKVKLRIRRIKMWCYSTASSIAVAASALFGYVSQIIYTSIGMNQQMVAIVARGGTTDAEELINSAIENIEHKKFKDGLSILDQAQEMNDAQIRDLSETVYIDEYESEAANYALGVLKVQQEEIAWLRVVTYTRKGNIVRSRHLLKQIINDNGIHANDARSMLDDMNHLKKK